MRANRTNEQGSAVSAGEVSQNVREVRGEVEENHRQARGEYQIAGELNMDGCTLGQLQSRRDSSDANSNSPVCPACNHSFPRLSRQDVFCHPDHRREFNNQKRRLRRGL
jgi:hypothetical protein